MSEFLSLEQFLLLPELDYENEFREFYEHKTGTQWYYWYQLAKASFNQFGNDGPPIGSKVLTLVSGHGGSGADERTFGGPDSNGRFFQLNSYNGVSLLTKASWWREIVCIDPEPTGWGPYPKHFYKKQYWSDIKNIVHFIVGT